MKSVTHAAKTVAAVDRTVTARTERHRGVRATVAAYDGKGLTLSTTEATTATAGAATTATAGGASTDTAAGRTTLGMVGKTARRMELLLTHGEKELGTAVGAFQSNVRKRQSKILQGI